MSGREGRSRKEQIERDRQAIERLQNRIKQNEAKEREKERKERTKRLIESSAMQESILKFEVTPEIGARIANIYLVLSTLLGRKLNDDDVKSLHTFLQNQEERGGYFTKAMNSK